MNAHAQNSSTFMTVISVVVVLAAGLVRPAHAGAGMQAFEKGDFETALRVWRPYAEHGSARAQYNISVMHEKGLGLEKDPEAAFEWLLRAAASGSLIAQRRLADRYDTGTVVPQDLKQAHKWYLSSALQDDVDAQRRLGFMYATGQGVSRDAARAYMWFRIATRAGDTDAKKDLKLLAADLTPSQISQGERLAQAWIDDRRAKD